MRAGLPPSGNGGALLVYQPRDYRQWAEESGLVGFRAAVAETDLYVKARKDLEPEARAAILTHRSALEAYVADHPDFLTSLEPVPASRSAPEMVREMAEAAAKVGVGPMAAVAGAIAEKVGRELLRLSPEVIVENGGDIFLRSLKQRLVGVYAGDSPFTGAVALEVQWDETPLGVCTSSGTVGHSLSFGQADAVIALSSSTALADAAATAIGNRIHGPEDVPAGIEYAQTIEGLRGLVVIIGDRLGIWGEVRLRTLQRDEAGPAGTSAVMPADSPDAR